MNETSTYSEGSESGATFFPFSACERFFSRGTRPTARAVVLLDAASPVADSLDVHTQSDEQWPHRAQLSERRSSVTWSENGRESGRAP
eukprot:6363-Prymnesium_polylepis.1